ncbi:glycosyltransferase family 25 protein [Roseovarius sp. SCSIO 43702]|uniref:glycosyltransferase family 25 protein n=1 Tax=Roseovarius sp. SCSIO 43702 TaxID=2823043 RepID=UPI001C72D30D|nr:glycosyltransferase family 25 protein [Roseovarius sp. SCSIO 43702]QYX56242.1 glycosyltransferase family 25 protein [Roseovarius sp. SCSIO 43702]
MEICAFILHLTRASARRENAQSLRDTCGLPAEIWPAVDGAAMSATELEARVDAGLFTPTYPFSLRTGEIGCFLSHRQIWAEIVRRDLDAALILEDDAGLDPVLFDRALDLARVHVSALGYIQFQTRPPRSNARLIDTNDPCQLLLPVVGGLRTTAQIVHHEAARRLLETSSRFDRPVDTFVQSHWQTGIRPAMILPSGISEIADRLDGSTIQGTGKSLAEKASREVKRGLYRRAVARASRHSPAHEPETTHD